MEDILLRMSQRGVAGHRHFWHGLTGSCRLERRKLLARATIARFVTTSDGRQSVCVGLVKL